MLSLLFILCGLQPFLISTAALPQNSANNLATGPPTTTPTATPYAIKFFPPELTLPIPTAESGSIPTIASTSPVSAASSQTTNTTEHTLDIPGLNLTELSAEGDMFNFGPEKAFNVRCFAARYVHSIANPSDCGLAVRRVLHGPKKFSRFKYKEPKSWSVKSCGVYFGPEHPPKGVEEKFSRFAIFNAVSDIMRVCLNEKNGFRGGLLPMGLVEKTHLVIVGPRDLEGSAVP